ncbi:MAG: ImmA/IrrE family metallo-endopeptidase [Treponema sp.]|nr:ImmA/IrrE family metallo-endopeptidase [Treponema sp.]
MNEKLKPFKKTSPGEIIVRMMDSLGWTQSDLAEISGLGHKKISYLINNKQCITTETAGLLGRIFNKSPDFWMKVALNYEISKKDDNEISKEDLAEAKAQMHKYMPVAEIKRKGWFVSNVSSISEIENEYERLFGQKTFPVKQFENNSLGMAARQTRDDTDFTKYYRSAWFSFAKMYAKKIASSSLNKNSYNEDVLRKIAFSLYTYTTLSNGIEKFLSDISHAGVHFFVLSHLSKTYLDGAAFIESDKPFIVYTGRYDREDNFWFVVAHEIAHILLHYDFLKEPFLDDMEDTKIKNQNEREKEADKQAGIFLNQQEVLKFKWQINRYVTEDRLQRISQASNVSVPIALGMLQHDGVVPWNQFTKYKPKVIHKIPSEYIKG